MHQTASCNASERIPDVKSERMLIRVEQGKGRR